MIGIILTTSPVFNFVSCPCIAEESTPFTAINKFLTSKGYSFTGLFLIK